MTNLVPVLFPVLIDAATDPRCETRCLDERRCPDCNLFTRRIGPGGSCVPTLRRANRPSRPHLITTQPEETAMPHT
jgi:hypothetical protein